METPPAATPTAEGLEEGEGEGEVAEAATPAEHENLVPGSAANNDLLKFTVPPGKLPGQVIYVPGPDGEIVRATIPEGYGPGQTFRIKVKNPNSEPVPEPVEPAAAPAATTAPAETIQTPDNSIMDFSKSESNNLTKFLNKIFPPRNADEHKNNIDLKKSFDNIIDNAIQNIKDSNDNITNFDGIDYDLLNKELKRFLPSISVFEEAGIFGDFDEAGIKIGKPDKNYFENRQKQLENELAKIKATKNKIDTARNKQNLKKELEEIDKELRNQTTGGKKTIKKNKKIKNKKKTKRNKY
jgi:hypothetical protein